MGRWAGVVTHKLPSDMWLYQEILFEVRPSVVVEVGTRFGGATTFFADVMARVHGSAGEGWRVITVDIDTACDPTARNTPGVEVFTAPSASLRVSHARRPPRLPAVPRAGTAPWPNRDARVQTRRRVEELRREFPGPVFVILDGDHGLACLSARRVRGRARRAPAACAAN